MELANSITGDTIVKILGVGLSGFGFLLMYMAYRLIVKAMGLPDVKPTVLSIIKIYIFASFVMTIAVGVFTYISAGYKQQLIADQTAAIKNKTAAFNMLSAVHKNSNAADTVISKTSKGQSSQLAKTEQKTALDTISKYLAKTSKPAEIKKFNTAKAVVLSYHDSISKIAPTDTRKLLTLKASYQQANYVIDSVTIKAAKAQSVINTVTN